MNFLDGDVIEAADGGFAIDAGSGIIVRGRGSAIKGTRVRVGIRPERMTATAGTSAGTANSAAADVISKVYLGDQVQLMARLATGASIVVREQRSKAQQTIDTINPGDSVVLGWDEAAPLLLGEELPTRAAGQEES
jgi:ABC-type Fe3+/spermidine/putrescine transport system ATPase subunit